MKKQKVVITIESDMDGGTVKALVEFTPTVDFNNPRRNGAVYAALTFLESLNRKAAISRGDDDPDHD